MMHSPALSLSQFSTAARRAASRSFRQAAPACLPSSVVARAPHIRGPTLPTTLQPPAPHSPSATSSARFPVCWFQLTPYLPVPLSQAIAPYPPNPGKGRGETGPGTAGAMVDGRNASLGTHSIETTASEPSETISDIGLTLSKAPD